MPPRSLLRNCQPFLSSSLFRGLLAFELPKLICRCFGSNTVVVRDFTGNPVETASSPAFTNGLYLTNLEVVGFSSFRGCFASDGPFRLSSGALSLRFTSLVSCSSSLYLWTGTLRSAVWMLCVRFGVPFWLIRSASSLRSGTLLKGERPSCFSLIM